MKNILENVKITYYGWKRFIKTSILASEMLPLSHLQGYVCSKNHHKKVAAQGKKNGGGEQLFLALSSDVCMLLQKLSA